MYWTGLLLDVRHAVRTIRTKPAFSLAALHSLALGIGANTAIFSVLNAVLIRPLAYPQSDAPVGVYNRIVIQGEVFENAELSAGMFEACTERARAFESFGGCCEANSYGIEFVVGYDGLRTKQKCSRLT